MQLSDSTRHGLAWVLLAIGLLATVPALVLFYATDFTVEHRGSYTCWDLRSDTGEVTAWWSILMFFSPLVWAVLSYIAVVFVAPQRIRGTRWRFAIGVPVAALTCLILYLLVLAPWFYYGDTCSS